MIDNLPEHVGWLAKINANFRESIYQFVLFGMTTPQIISTQSVATALVVGVLSAFGGAYLTAERTAVELKQYAREQGEFRAELRQYMRESAVELRSLADRMTRQEVMSSTLHVPNERAGGVNGSGRK